MTQSTESQKLPSVPGQLTTGLNMYVDLWDGNRKEEVHEELAWSRAMYLEEGNGKIALQTKPSGMSSTQARLEQQQRWENRYSRQAGHSTHKRHPTQSNPQNKRICSVHTNSSHLPSLHAHSAQNWLAEESLKGVELHEKRGLSQPGMTTGEGRAGAYGFLGVLENERVATEDGGDEDLELHVRKVLTHTRPVYQ